MQMLTKLKHYQKLVKKIHSSGTTVFGGLSLALGAALLAGRRRSTIKNKQYTTIDIILSKKCFNLYTLINTFLFEMIRII